MSVVMTETPEAPAEERRGTGREDFDWGTVRPGEELPDREDTVDAADGCGLDDDRDTAPLWHSCGLPGCGGD